MPGSFFDTNVLLYAAGADPRKAALARSLIADRGTVSVQVLNEVVSVARRKMRLDWEEVERLIGPFTAMLVVIDLTIDIHYRGVVLARRYELAVYDAMIVAAALAAGCDTLWSEDMHAGLVVDKRLTIRNPFS